MSGRARGRKPPAPGTTVWTASPQWQVPAGLPSGLHRFALSVVTQDGRRSRRDVVAVRVAGAPASMPDTAP